MKELYSNLESILKDKDVIDPIDYSEFEDSAEITLYDVGPNGQDEFFKEAKDVNKKLNEKGYKTEIKFFPEEVFDKELLGAQARISNIRR